MFMRKLLKKIVAGVIAASVMAVSVFASPADAYAASAGRVPSGISRIGKGTINIYSWDNDLEAQVRLFKKTYPKYADQVNYVNLNMSGISDEYHNALDNKVRNGGSSAPDIICWDSDDIGYGMSKSYTVPLVNIGFDARWYNNAYNYTKVLGKKNGRLTAIATTVYPGAYIYNRKAAKTAFGTDYSITVQSKVKNWGTFLASAKTAKSKGIKMVSGVGDTYPALLYSSTTALSKNGSMQFPSNVATMYNVSKSLKNGNYTNNTTQWTSEWSNDMGNPRVLGYFAPSWLVQIMPYSCPNVNLKNYALVEGPADYYWGGSFLTATNKCHNKGLAQLFLYTVACNKDFQCKYAVVSATVPNNMAATAKIISAKIGTRKFGTANDPYKVYDKVARKIKGRPATKYDMQVDSSLSSGIYYLGLGEISSYKEFRYVVRNEVQRTTPLY